MSESVGAQLRRALETSQELALENDRLRAENESLRAQIAQWKPGQYHLTEKGLAAIQADPKGTS